MSGVKRLVLNENGGLEVPTNEDLKEEGTEDCSSQDEE